LANDFAAADADNALRVVPQLIARLMADFLAR
jgi:hypothetical protein